MSNPLLSSATSAGATGASMQAQFINKMSIQSYVTGTGSVTATVIVEGSNNESDWVPITTLTMSGTNRASDGGVLETFFQQIRARVTAISGTSASVSVDYISR
uniref:Uncharacterized protein n=3 Tax=unclassified bacterial viruses TaxID=12333 RepID=A0AAU6W2W1_9VIRU